jgi:hypothetical protein
MRLDREHRDLVNDLFDEAVLRHGKNHVDAASNVIDELRSMEAGGHAWAAVVLEACLLDGMTKRIKGRAKRSVVAVPSKTGRVATMPAQYSRRTAEGSHQMAFWYDMPLEELAVVIESMTKQAGVLNQRVNRMRRGHDLAVEHQVGTAREGFAAVGIDIEAVAS